MSEPLDATNASPAADERDETAVAPIEDVLITPDAPTVAAPFNGKVLRLSPVERARIAANAASSLRVDVDRDEMTPPDAPGIGG